MSDSIGKQFRALHEQNQLFVMPNPWDAGSARILEKAGFKALATTSAGMAYALAKCDGTIGRDAVLKHCADIVAATKLPVSADLENGFGDSPQAVFDTVIAAADIGLAGCSIEDHTGNVNDPIFDSVLAIERIEAACAARDSLPEDFVLTARCERLVWGGENTQHVIQQLQAYEAAGADVLFAPGIEDIELIRQTVASLTRPLNIIMQSPDLGYGLDELAAVGVSRVSVGSSLAQLAYASLIRAAKEINEKGGFEFIGEAVDYTVLESYFSS